MKPLDPLIFKDIILLLIVLGALICVANGDYPQL